LALTRQGIGRNRNVHLPDCCLSGWGATLRLPFYLPHSARAHVELGQFEAAWRCIGEAISRREVHRSAGEIALMGPQPDGCEAEAHFARAIAIARKKAMFWELRATTSLARLWWGQGRRSEAHDRLAPIYSWFTEGFDTVDLKDAKALLYELYA
jgi:hypothetical protein